MTAITRRPTFSSNREPNEHRDRARTQATRARQLDSLLGKVAARSAPLRVIVNEGDMRAEADLGRDSSVVRVRHLDPVAWRFAHYDTISGEFILERDSAVALRDIRKATEPAQVRYVDQHDLAGSDMPERRAASGTVLVRDAGVRAIVLERADGHCEFCDAAGFLTQDGRLYAETHHVVPLAEGGVDRVWNVVALCSNHHREAHFGAASAAMRTHLLSTLLEMYPPAPKLVRIERVTMFVVFETLSSAESFSAWLVRAEAEAREGYRSLQG